MKHYFILSPVTSTERTSELQTKAQEYYGEDYGELLNNYIEIPTLLQTGTNVALALIGVSIIRISQCDSVYMAKGWEDDNYCKVCHALAFSHGVDIVYEPI